MDGMALPFSLSDVVKQGGQVENPPAFGLDGDFSRQKALAVSVRLLDGVKLPNGSQQVFVNRYT